MKFKIVFLFIYLIQFSDAKLCRYIHTIAEGRIQFLLIQVKEFSHTTVLFNRDRCGLPIQSKYLPIRPGFIHKDGSHNELIGYSSKIIAILYKYNFRPSLFTKPAYSNIKLQFFAYTEIFIKLQMHIFFSNNFFLFFNDQFIKKYKSLNSCTSMKSCSTSSKISAYTSITKNIDLDLNWNFLSFEHIPYNKNININLVQNLDVSITPFIPYYTSVPTYCNTELNLSKINKVTAIKINMNFTYGHKLGLYKLIQCLYTLIPYKYQNKVNVTGKLNNIYAFIKIEASQYFRYNFLINFRNRANSKKCIEYTCVWYIIKPIQDNLNHLVLNKFKSLGSNKTKLFNRHKLIQHVYNIQKSMYSSNNSKINLFNVSKPSHSNKSTILDTIKLKFNIFHRKGKSKKKYCEPYPSIEKITAYNRISSITITPIYLINSKNDLYNII